MKPLTYEGTRLLQIAMPMGGIGAGMVFVVYLALRSIADYFEIAYNPHAKAEDPISVSRAEFDTLLDHLEADDVPLKADRDQAWRDFSGWRVNYDTVLVALAGLTAAPPAPWSSDRTRTNFFNNRVYPE